MNKFEMGDYVRLKYSPDHVGVITNMRYEYNHYEYQLILFLPKKDFLNGERLTWEGERFLIKLTNRKCLWS